MGTPYNGLYMYGEASPKRGIFFRLQVYERVGISLVKVYKRLRGLAEPGGPWCLTFALM